MSTEPVTCDLIAANLRLATLKGWQQGPNGGRVASGSALLHAPESELPDWLNDNACANRLRDEFRFTITYAGTGVRGTRYVISDAEQVWGTVYVEEHDTAEAAMRYGIVAAAIRRLELTLTMADPTPSPAAHLPNAQAVAKALRLAGLLILSGGAPGMPPPDWLHDQAAADKLREDFGFRVASMRKGKRGPRIGIWSPEKLWLMVTVADHASEEAAARYGIVHAAVLVTQMSTMLAALSASAVVARKMKP